MNQEQIKKNWESRGYSFGIFKDPPGQVWADFVHRTNLSYCQRERLKMNLKASQSNLQLVRKYLFLLMQCIQFVMLEIKITFGIMDTKRHERRTLYITSIGLIYKNWGFILEVQNDGHLL